MRASLHRCPRASPWPGKKIDLCKFSTSRPVSPSQAAARTPFSAGFRSTTSGHARRARAVFDDTPAFLSEWNSGANFDGVPEVAYSTRPYRRPAARTSWKLYLMVSNCDGLARDFYHYDAGGHALLAIGASAQQLQALSTAAEFAMDAPGPRGADHDRRALWAIA